MAQKALLAFGPHVLGAASRFGSWWRRRTMSATCGRRKVKIIIAKCAVNGGYGFDSPTMVQRLVTSTLSLLSCVVFGATFGVDDARFLIPRPRCCSHSSKFIEEEAIGAGDGVSGGLRFLGLLMPGRPPF